MYWSSGRHWGTPISKMLTHFIIHIKTSHPLVSLSISSGESVVNGSCQVLMVNTVFQSSNYVWEVKLYDGQQIPSVFFEKAHLVHFQEKVSNTQTERPLVCGSLSRDSPHCPFPITEYYKNEYSRIGTSFSNFYCPVKAMREWYWRTHGWMPCAATVWPCQGACSPAHHSFHYQCKLPMQWEKYVSF